MKNTWTALIAQEQQKQYYQDIVSYLDTNYKFKTILPPRENIFKALNLCPLDKVKCVILGQDPYPTPGHACGLAFSVNPSIPIPRSLANIFKELVRDTGLQYPSNGDLTPWAEQGVMLLNTTLTVEANSPGSHLKLGWANFTDEVIKTISTTQPHVVFMLWGKQAQTKEPLIDTSKHLILKTSHPSPHAFNLGFNGCGHFTKANNFLKENNIPTIDWTL